VEHRGSRVKRQRFVRLNHGGSPSCLVVPFRRENVVYNIDSEQTDVNRAISGVGVPVNERPNCSLSDGNKGLGLSVLVVTSLEKSRSWAVVLLMVDSDASRKDHGTTNMTAGGFRADRRAAAGLTRPYAVIVLAET
jgi:hypothetical protein